MADLDAVLAVLYDAIDEANATLERGKIEKTPDAVLFGRGGVLDSLGLVNLVVGVEQRIEDQFGAMVTLADERAMSQKNSPFRTVGALAEYVLAKLQEGSARGG